MTERREKINPLRPQDRRVTTALECRRAEAGILGTRYYYPFQHDHFTRFFDVIHLNNRRANLRINTRLAWINVEQMRIKSEKSNPSRRKCSAARSEAKLYVFKD
jgi:hypothetical protein